MNRGFSIAAVVFLAFGNFVSAQPLLTSPQLLSTPVGDSEAPRVVASGNNLYLAYKGDPFANGASETKVLFRRSLDGGQTWRVTLDLTSQLSAIDLLPHKAIDGPALAAFAGNVYVVWADGASGNYEIYLMRSTNGGAIFAPAQGATSLDPGNISDTIGDSRCPAVAADGSNVYVVWKDNTNGVFQIWYALSTDSGENFGLPSIISAMPPVPGREVHCPAIAADQGTVVIAWAEEGERGTAIQYVRSFDSGQSFIGPTSLASKRRGRVESLRLAAYGSLFVVAWAESDDSGRSDGLWQVFVARSPNRGKSFRVGKAISLKSQISGGRRQTESEGHSKFPDVTIWNGSVWLLLANNKNENFDIYLFQSTNGGKTFRNLGKISYNASNSLYPAITASHDRLHVVWADDAMPPLPARLRLYYRRSAPQPAPPLAATSSRAVPLSVRYEPRQQSWSVALGDVGTNVVKLELSIYDLSGRVVHRSTSADLKIPLTLPLERLLANGIYLYTVVIERRDGLQPLYLMDKMVVQR